VPQTGSERRFFVPRRTTTRHSYLSCRCSSHVRRPGATMLQRAFQARLLWAASKQSSSIRAFSPDLNHHPRSHRQGLAEECAWFPQIIRRPVVAQRLCLPRNQVVDLGSPLVPRSEPGTTHYCHQSVQAWAFKWDECPASFRILTLISILAEVIEATRRSASRVKVQL
jgi:hypothetical protein